MAQELFDQADHDEMADRQIAEVQAALDFHPDASPFWDGDQGQEFLSEARALGLSARNTNRERCALYAEERRRVREAEAEAA